MKRITLFLFAFLECLWLFGCSNYPKTYCCQNQNLLGKFTLFSSLKVPWQTNQIKNEDNPFYSNSMASNNGGATEWARTYGGEGEDKARFVVQTTDGGYVVAGFTKSFVDTRVLALVWLIKLSSSGSIEWQRTYGPPASGSSYVGAAPSLVQQTYDGGYIVVGEWNGEETDGLRVLIFKLSSDGDVEWARISSGKDFGERGDYVQQTNDGGYIIAGLTGAYGDLNHKDFWLIKLSSNGNIEWQRTYGGRDYEGDWLWGNRIPTLIQTSEGGYILAGDTHSFGAGWSDIWLIKLSRKGDVEWQRTYGGEESEWLYRSGPHILETNDKGYIVAGETLSFGVGWNAIWIFKVSQKGDVIWQRTYKGERGDRANSIQPTSDGGYIVAGTTESFGARQTDFWLIKLSSGGDVEWQRTYGGERADDACSIQQTNDGGYIVAGTTRSFDVGLDDILIFKLSSNGELGPGCGIVGESTAIVSDTYVLPSNTNISPLDTDDTFPSIDITSNNTSCTTKLLCWNLNQPPENVSLREEINRSLFRAEALNIISWEPHPYNSQFEITEYRVYRKNAKEYYGSYELIGSVPSNTFEYKDFISNLEEEFAYVVTSVASDGTESPRSEPVEIGQ